MKCAIFHAQNLCSLPRKNFVCFVFSTNLVRYIIVWQNPDVKLKDGTKSIGKKVPFPVSFATLSGGIDYAESSKIIVS